MNHAVEMDGMICRLLPASNPDACDRRRAWDEWLLQGGAEPVLRFIRFSNGTREDDDEILQETLQTGFEKVEGGQYEDRSLPFTAFLKGIARYKILEAARRGQRERPLEQADDSPAGETQKARERADLWKERECLRGALAALPARRALVLLLGEWGYDTHEIAALLRIRADLVRKEKSLALRHLRVHLAYLRPEPATEGRRRCSASRRLAEVRA
jgi:DNA-directed RNA polymerase specialized sigma24 family protein